MVYGFGLEGQDFNSADKRRSPEALPPAGTERKPVRKQVITVEEIVAAIQDGTFKIETGMRLTPLAADYLKEHHIRILK